jgi:hypothetical protein
MQLVRRLSLATLSAALLLGACWNDDDDPIGPTTAQVVGTYRATTFTATGPLGADNILQSGGSLTATFNADGTVTGHVTIPSQSVNEDFQATWKIDGRKVEIEEGSTDNFVEDLEFSVVGATLVADETFSGVRVQLTLTKQ